jgi:hypothetical protein
MLPLIFKTQLTGTQANWALLATLAAQVCGYSIRVDPCNSQSITAKVGTEGATNFFLFWNIFREL